MNVFCDGVKTCDEVGNTIALKSLLPLVHDEAGNILVAKSILPGILRRSRLRSRLLLGMLSEYS